MKTMIKNMKAIVANIPSELMTSLGATNPKPVSARTLQFDCKPKADGTNRIKVTLTEHGKLMVRGFKIEETDLMFDIEPGSLATALKNLGDTTLPSTPTIY